MQVSEHTAYSDTHCPLLREYNYLKDMQVIERGEEREKKHNYALFWFLFRQFSTGERERERERERARESESGRKRERARESESGRKRERARETEL